jgi:hypothetical protein
VKPFAFAAALAAGLLLSGLILPGPAVAASPTDVEVAQIQQLLGFDVAIERVIVGKIDKSEAFKGYSEQERGCIKGELMPELKASMLDSFRSLFGDGETIAAWKTFGQTKGGAKFVAGMREQVKANIDNAVDGTPMAEPVQFFKGMEADELLQVVEFMRSPAGKVLERDFPDTDVSPAQLEELGQRVSQRCGVQMPKA